MQWLLLDMTKQSLQNYDEVDILGAAFCGRFRLSARTGARSVKGLST
jgi:hypothetical protein